MAFKTFAPGVLTSSDVNTFLMKQAVITCTAATRPASPNEGMTIYETDTDIVKVYNGTAWVDFSHAVNAAWTSFTPTFSQITIGNGTVTARYMKIGKTVYYKGQIVYGSTTTYGNTASDSIIATTPTTMITTGFAGHLGVARYSDVSTGITYPAFAQVASSTTLIIQFGVTNLTANTVTGSAFNNNFPVAEQVNDEIGWMFIYEEA